MKILKWRYKKGFSLIELLLAIGVILVLAISIFLLSSKLYSARKSEQEIENIKTVTAGISQLYATKNSFDGIKTSLLIKAGIFPPEMIIKNNTYIAYNSFKGYFQVVETVNNNLSNSLGSAYIIEDSAIPPENCIDIVSALKNNFYKILVGSTMIINKFGENGSSFEKNTTFNINNLVKACNNGTAENKNNQLTFYSS